MRWRIAARRSLKRCDALMEKQAQTDQTRFARVAVQANQHNRKRNHKAVCRASLLGCVIFEEETMREKKENQKKKMGREREEKR